MKYQYLVSACLAGINCRYNGKNCLNLTIKKWVDAKIALAVCPEELGLLPTPRPCAEIKKDEKGQPRVINSNQQDITAHFIAGSLKVVELCRQYQIKKAVLKSNSPSCGYGRIYDGSFSGQLIPGHGITARALRRSGIIIYTESDLDQISFWSNLI